MIIRILFLVLSLLLIAGAAAAQSPISGGRRHQPTRQEIDSRGLSMDREWNRSAQTVTDRLYDEIMRAAIPPDLR